MKKQIKKSFWYLMLSICVLVCHSYKLKYSDILMGLGEKSYKSKDYLGAIYYLDSCILLDPRNDQCRFTRGNVAYKMGNFELGKKMFKDVLFLTDYKDAVAWNMLGLCCQELKQYDTAETCFKNAVKLKTEESKFYANWGKNEYLKGNYEHAEQLYNTAIFLDPNHAAHVMNRAEVLNKLGKKENAISDLKKYANAHPNDAQVKDKIDELSKWKWTGFLPYLLAGFVLIGVLSFFYYRRKKEN